MNWADRAALAVAGVVMLCGVAAYCVLMIGTHMAGALALAPDLLLDTAAAAAGIALPLWLVLRTIAWVRARPTAVERREPRLSVKPDLKDPV